VTSTADRRRRATAIHEAGHAVAAWRLGRAFRSVTIRADEDSLGHVRHRDVPAWVRPDVEGSTRTRLFLEDSIIIALVGPEAERRIAGRAPATVRKGAAHDHESAVDLASHLAGSTKERDALLAWLRVRAQDLVDHDRPRIELLAAALLRQDVLTWKAVKTLLNDSVLKRLH